MDSGFAYLTQRTLASMLPGAQTMSATGAGKRPSFYCTVFVDIVLSFCVIPCISICAVSAFLLMSPGTRFHGLETGSLWYVIPAIAAP